MEGIEGLESDDVASIKDGSFCGMKITSTTTVSDVGIIKQPIIVATIQSLSARLKDPRTKGPLMHWLRNVCKLVMVDETQAVGTMQWEEVLNEVGAPYRICLSATPRRTDGATLKIFAASGPLLYDTSAEVQIANGRLCELDIQYHPFDHKLYNDNDSDLNYPEIYQSCIVSNDQRNDFIANKTLELLEEERFVLILIQMIDHGHIIKEALIKNGLESTDVNFIWGDTPTKIRNQVIDDFRQGKFKVLIGSTIADAGLDIKLISGVILAGAGNSDITLIQRIGRGARNCDYNSILGYEPKFIRDNNGKKVTTIIDVLDNNVAFFKKQAKNRYYNARTEFGADRVHIVGATASIFKAKSKKTASLKDVDQEKAMQDMFAVFNNIDTVNQKENKEEVVDSNMSNFLNAFKR